MAATGETTNYKLPLYNAGDTTSDLVTFNGAMNKIDANMTAINTIAEAGVNGSDTNATAIEKIQGDLVTMNTSITQANGNAVGALNQIQEIVNVTKINFTASTGVSGGYVNKTDNIVNISSFNIAVNTTLPKTVINGSEYQYVYKIDNNNVFQFNAGERKAACNALCLNNLYQIILITTLYAAYDGLNSYIIVAGNIAEQDYVINVFTAGLGTGLNTQPKNL